MDYQLALDNEFMIQKEKIEKNAKMIILYGNSIVSCILKTAVRELCFCAKCVIFDNGKFLSQTDDTNYENNIVVILCSSRLSTRNDMLKCTRSFFPDANVFDFYAIYYAWITKVVKRSCDYKILAETLYLCRQDQCIHNIDSINTFFCNLRCKECSNGIQYRKEKKRIFADSQIYHLEKLTDKLPISQCNFQGGEVFTDVNFPEFVEKHSYNSRIGIFTIATNATILPTDSVFKVIKSTGSMIRISDYGTISKEKQTIIDKCNEFDIPCFTFPMAKTWRRFGEYQKRNRTEEQLKHICNKCCFGIHDIMFVDDKIYCCLRTLYANAVGDHNDAMIANTLDLNSEFTIKELENLVQGKELWRMCDYCDFPMEEIEPAEQI